MRLVVDILIAVLNLQCPILIGQPIEYLLCGGYGAVCVFLIQFHLGRKESLQVNLLFECLELLEGKISGINQFMQVEVDIVFEVSIEVL